MKRGDRVRLTATAIQQINAIALNAYVPRLQQVLVGDTATVHSPPDENGVFEVVMDEARLHILFNSDSVETINDQENLQVRAENS